MTGLQPTGENGATRAPIFIELCRDDSLSSRVLVLQIDNKSQQVSASALRRSLQDRLSNVIGLQNSANSLPDEIHLNLCTSTVLLLRIVGDWTVLAYSSVDGMLLWQQDQNPHLLIVTCIDLGTKPGLTEMANEILHFICLEIYGRDVLIQETCLFHEGYNLDILADAQICFADLFPKWRDWNKAEQNMVGRNVMKEVSSIGNNDGDVKEVGKAINDVILQSHIIFLILLTCIYLPLAAPPLKLIDLPGLDQRVADDSFISDYAAHSDAILLVIVPAAQAPEISSSRALKLAHDLDNEGN
eukprot:Gb_19016 [translate_table: standard]